jgi:SAM-dependent methyltransferase
MVDTLQNSYDLVADAYAEHFRNELDHKPFDRKMLDWLAEKVADRGVICDMGCGPGHVAGYLHERGAEVCGVDLSAEMVKQATRLNPNIKFMQGDMLQLTNVPDVSYGGIAAFYSIVHIPRTSLSKTLAELRRVLCGDGILLLTHHIGSDVVHLDEFLGKQVSMDFIFFQTDEVKSQLLRAGFVVEEVIERDPYPDVEYQSRRAYIFARNPGT